jgi:hypothetical protein
LKLDDEGSILCTRNYIDGYNEREEEEDEVIGYGTGIRVLRASGDSLKWASGVGDYLLSYVFDSMRGNSN